jgi:hypothetical protein
MASQTQMAKRHGPGRPTGRSAKTTGEAKDNIAEVFQILGGVEGMAKWATQHPKEFYCRVYPKLIGVNVQAAKSDETLKRDDNSAKEALARIFDGIFAARQNRHADDPVVIDQDQSGGAAPESAVARTNGSAAVGKGSS